MKEKNCPHCSVPLLCFLIEDNGVCTCTSYFFCQKCVLLFQEDFDGDMMEPEFFGVKSFVGLKEWNYRLFRLAEYLYFLKRKPSLEKRLNEIRAHEKNVDLYSLVLMEEKEDNLDLRNLYLSLEDLVEQEQFSSEISKDMIFLKASYPIDSLQVSLEDGYFHAQLRLESKYIPSSSEIFVVFPFGNPSEMPFDVWKNTKSIRSEFHQRYSYWRTGVWQSLKRETKIQRIQDSFPFQVKPGFMEIPENVEMLKEMYQKPRL